MSARRVEVEEKSRRLPAGLFVSEMRGWVGGFIVQIPAALCSRKGSDWFDEICIGAGVVSSYRRHSKNTISLLSFPPCRAQLLLFPGNKNAPALTVATTDRDGCRNDLNIWVVERCVLFS